MKIIHAADIHLGSPLSSIDDSLKREKRKNEIEEMFEQFRGLIDIDVSNYLSKQENIINNYIREANHIFINKKYYIIPKFFMLNLNKIKMVFKSYR